MPAYLIVEHWITDAAKFEEYRVAVGPLIAKHGGRYMTKGGTHRVLENPNPPPDRIVIIEFPDMAAIDAWYADPAYQPLIALRQSAVDVNRDMIITLDGA